MDKEHQQYQKLPVAVASSVDRRGHVRRAHTRMQRMLSRARASGVVVSKRFDSALSMATQAHAGQIRKGTENEYGVAIPYITHPVAVAALIVQHGGDEDQAIAGLLHDVLEDGGPQWREPIFERFGTRVLGMVEACTDGVPDSTGRKPPWKQRKEAYLAHLAEASDDALLVSACDKLHNLQSILADRQAIGDKVFDRFTASKAETLWYYGELVKTLSSRVPKSLGAALESAGKALQGRPRP
jgi:(p)ppGpp synthase/HD superfamily hydrolase